jgi:osmoprotectant transport system permease protein
MSAALHQQLLLLPDRLGWHVLLTLMALAAGIVISMPLAIMATRRRAIQGPMLAAASVVQTVPSLALLALMVVLLGRIGFWPAIVALVLYSILPILRNAVTGIAGVDPAMVEAARGVGMTPRQMLLKVQLPLAAPVIIAGIRTSAVWVVGIATLSTPVGQVSLGNYIFEGLQLRNNTAVIVGVVTAAGLAIVLDGLIRLMEIAFQRRSRIVTGVAALGLCAVIVGGLAPLVRPAPDTIVGAKTFTEQYILADLIAMRLKDAGFRVRKTQGMGSSILFDSLANGSVDCYVDYSGTIWANVMKRTDTPAGPVVLQEATAYLKQHYGIQCLGPLGFANAYCLAMPRARARELGIRSIADLASHAPSLKIGGDYEFFARPEWPKVRDAYGLRFAQMTSLDPTLMYSAVREGSVNVISAFSTDGRILAYDLVVLEDPQRAFPPYDAMLLVSRRAAARPGFVQALRPLLGRIDDERMRQANKMVDLDGASPRQAAARLMEATGTGKR